MPLRDRSKTFFQKFWFFTETLFGWNNFFGGDAFLRGDTFFKGELFFGWSTFFGWDTFFEGETISGRQSFERKRFFWKRDKYFMFINFPILKCAVSLQFLVLWNYCSKVIKIPYNLSQCGNYDVQEFFSRRFLFMRLLK